MTYLNITTVLQVESSLSSVGEWTSFCSSGKLESTLKSTSPELAQPWEDEHGCKCCTVLGEKCSCFLRILSMVVLAVGGVELSLGPPLQQISFTKY